MSLRVSIGFAALAWAANATAALTGFPAPVRAWETIPGVVRNDGVATFRIEVDVNGPVRGVTLADVDPCLAPATPDALLFRDDGRGADRTAGDLVFTAGPLRFACAMRPFMRDDASSPAGVDVAEFGTVRVTELDGSTTAFLGRPGIGLVAPDVPSAPVAVLGADVAVSPHLVNVRSPGRLAQRFLRFSDAPTELTRAVYAVVPDAFDFLMVFSTGKLERLDTPARDLVAGSHHSVRVNFTGTGQATVDETAAYGSAGRLQGVNVLDTYDRGLLGNVVTHEVLHQWVAYVDPALGIGDGVHFGPLTSVASLVGGFRWVPLADGTFVYDCTEGRSGAHHAAPLDLYMMGLIDGASVPITRVSATATPVCGGIITSVARTVTIGDIQARHGVRAPGPAAAQRDFALGFVAESRDRLLDANEMTFYDILAAHYTHPLASDVPDPYHGSAEWPSVVRFFGQGATWRSDVPACGNGRVDAGEECDDGNRVAGDGCSAACRVETGEIVVATLATLPAVNPRSNGTLTVVLLGGSAFDARSANVPTIRFGPTGTEAAPIDAALRDASGDGVVDLVLRFKTRDAGFACGATTAIVAGRTVGGVPFAATGPVVLRGC
jgi:cysteine-rich repeat protein